MDGCNRIHELWDRQAAGDVVGEDDAALIRSHLARCPDCRLEADAVAAMDLDGPDGPPPWADDLSRRRMVDAVVEGADRRVAGGRARRWRRLAAVGIGAAAAAALILWIVAGPGSGVPGGSGSPAIAAASPAPLDGRVLLISGDLEAASASLDRGLAAGDPLPVASGPIVIGLGQGVRVALEPGVAGRVARLDREAVILEVDAGSLIARIDPDRERPRFSIRAPGGAIEVAGTVFHLDVAGDRSEVGVLRGRVALLEPGRAPRGLGIGEAAVLGREGRAPLAPAVEERSRRVLSLLDLLDPGSDARVEIRSLPAGAVVTLDDVPLGVTPLVAAVRPGHRAIALDLGGCAPVREILGISRGELVSRVFDLQAGGPAPPPAEGSGARVAKTTSAADLLAEAQTLRSAREWAGAAATYDAILRRHGSSTEARSAAISSATIKLDHLGDPRGALRLFEGYLARHGSGALAQEAAWGRCRALRALGRAAEERAALREFLAGHPAALEAGQARVRLGEIEK